MKRILTLMLVLGITLLPMALTGCGKTVDSAPSVSSDADSTPTEPQEETPSTTTSEGSGY